ncbi:MAG: subunit of meta cleavage enzyme [Betaproteobacteria bacterium]|nr:subunit of meta cleavage enzyme [Betaproteobacteria bacterium]
MSNWLQGMPTAEAYEMNKVLFELHHRPDDLEAFRVNPDQYLNRFSLTDPVRRAILGNDVAALYLAGANPYLLRAHCIGMKIPEAVSVGALKRLAGEH